MRSASLTVEEHAEMARDCSEGIDLHVGPDTFVGAVVEADVAPPFVTHEHRHREDRTDALGFQHRALGLPARRWTMLCEHLASPEQVDEPGEGRRVGMKVVVGIFEDLTDPGSVPLGSQVHPQPPLWVAHVLEQVGAVGTRSGAEVRQHLVQPAWRCHLPLEATAPTRTRPRPARPRPEPWDLPCHLTYRSRSGRA